MGNIFLLVFYGDSYKKFLIRLHPISHPHCIISDHEKNDLFCWSHFAYKISNGISISRVIFKLNIKKVGTMSMSNKAIGKCLQIMIYYFPVGFAHVCTYFFGVQCLAQVLSVQNYSNYTWFTKVKIEIRL